MFGKDKEKEVSDSVNLLEKQVYETKKNDYNVSLNYLDAQISNKKKQLSELESKIAELQPQLASLEDTLMREKKAILDQIDERRLKAELYERKAKENMEFTQRERNFIEQEKSTIMGKRVEVDNMASHWNEKINRLRVFLETVK